MTFRRSCGDAAAQVSPNAVLVGDAQVTDSLRKPD
jgi:hypothetical protein